MHVRGAAHDPHDPPQPSEPHARPPQLGVHPATHCPIALHVWPIAHVPHEPPQRSEPHARPAQFRVQESSALSSAGPLSTTSLPASLGDDGGGTESTAPSSEPSRGSVGSSTGTHAPLEPQVSPRSSHKRSTVHATLSSLQPSAVRAQSKLSATRTIVVLASVNTARRVCAVTAPPLVASMRNENDPSRRPPSRGTIAKVSASFAARPGHCAHDALASARAVASSTPSLAHTRYSTLCDVGALLLTITITSVGFEMHAESVNDARSNSAVRHRPERSTDRAMRWMLTKIPQRKRGPPCDTRAR